jgi:NAD(P)-dependent dehydrogenase (short-subunit alcohol dehydrogenase family)
MKRFLDKVVVVTGAGSGIGQATAVAFAQEGAKLHLVDIDQQRLEEVGRQIEALGADCKTHPLDCCDPKAMKQLAKTIYQLESRVDVLHNNAGVCYTGPVEEISLDDWKWVIDINLWGVIHGVHAFVPKMIAQGGGGHIVNTASMAGLIGLPYVAPYCTSKFAVVGLSESMALELAVHGIHVSTICPGSVSTNVIKDSRTNIPRKWRALLENSLSRWATSPKKTAAVILDTVYKNKSLTITAAAELLPLWLVKRFSHRFYNQMSKFLTKLALKGTN